MYNPDQYRGVSGGMKLFSSTQPGVYSRLVALNSSVMGRTQDACRDCPVSNGRVEGAVCDMVSHVDGVAFFSLSGVDLATFLSRAACKINQVNGVDLQTPNKFNVESSMFSSVPAQAPRLLDTEK